MKVLIQSKTLQVTEALRTFIERQAEKILRRQQRVNTITVFLESVGRKKNDVQAAIARMKVAVPGKDIVVERRARDMYEAVVEVTARAKEGLSRLKERRLTAKRSSRWHLGDAGWTG
ncbi:MAG TPA: ribosome-associated translation inhibitor RaiA [Vitreimonas sp.]|nr:ribosome-associated translation inhibitor RaiA [Vitreimonas sp.]